MLELTQGDLLAANVDALVNAVNTHGVMGKGIALQFKRAFPACFAAYAREAKAGQIQVGRMHVFETGTLVAPRFVINFPTKQHWRDPSRLEWITAGLGALVDEVRRREIRSLAIPALGCGNGGLSWATVEPLIRSAAAAVPEVRVLVFPPTISS